MPDTAQALLVTVVVVLPGLLYVLSFERVVGSWGVNLADRVLRFVAVSAVFQVLFAPAVQTVYRRYDPDAVLPPSVWAVTALYVALPLAAGRAVGLGYTRGASWARVVAGRYAAPRAWDFVWARRAGALVRLRLKSGRWIAGQFVATGDGRESYAGLYPEDGDLYLGREVVVDPLTGELAIGPDGRPVEADSAILVRWAEVEYLSFVDSEPR